MQDRKIMEQTLITYLKCQRPNYFVDLEVSLCLVCLCNNITIIVCRNILIRIWSISMNAELLERLQVEMLHRLIHFGCTWFE